MTVSITHACSRSRSPPPFLRDTVEGLNRREPLLAIADAAGGHWPDTARGACRHFVLDTGSTMTSPGVRLLADLWEIFTHAGTGRLRTTDILTVLCDLDEAPWGDLDGKPLDGRRLARELDRYGVKPAPSKDDGKTVKGYQTPGPLRLADAWDRYLPPRTPPSVTAVTPQVRLLPIPTRLPIHR